MKIRAIFVTTLLLSLGLHPVAAQAVKRIAITTSNKGKFQDQQNLIATKITSQLAGRSGLTIIDSDQVAQILKNQDTQNSDRYSPEGAVRIGKLLGAGVLVVVQVDDFSLTPSTKKTFSGSTTTGTVVLQATVRMTNMETGVILASPNASFRDSAELGKTSNNTAITILTKRPATSSTQDNSAAGDLVSKAISAVSTDLAGKIVESAGVSKVAAGASVAPAPTVESALVAGIFDGAVYINKGSTAGVKPEDHFQIIRTVELPMVDPNNPQKHLTSKKTICTFIVKSVEEDNASGSCDGAIPQAGDVAQPVLH